MHEERVRYHGVGSESFFGRINPMMEPAINRVQRPNTTPQPEPLSSVNGASISESVFRRRGWCDGRMFCCWEPLLLVLSSLPEAASNGDAWSFSNSMVLYCNSHKKRRAFSTQFSPPLRWTVKNEKGIKDGHSSFINYVPLAVAI